MTTRLEWQIKHGFDESEMQFLDRIIGLWHGKIVAVVVNPNREVLRPPGSAGRLEGSGAI